MVTLKLLHLLDTSRKFAIIGALILSTTAQAEGYGYQDTGFNIPSRKIDQPDYYMKATPAGTKINELYNANEDLLSSPFEKLPVDFDPVIKTIQTYILSKASLADTKSPFYVGPNGELNGENFDFDFNDLPTKLAKISFCFGIDPFILTGLIYQESHFFRHAKSSQAASGFTQLTNAGATEVSEQLGILGKGYHGADAPEVFTAYAQCYLGPNKPWQNIWETPSSTNHGATTIPMGAAAYKDGFTGKGRSLLNINLIKKWLNFDADRNLIYGAILFKMHLGKNNSNYNTALKEYNVSHTATYVKSVNSSYAILSKNYLTLLKNNNPLTRAELEHYIYNFKDTKCQVPAEDIAIVDRYNEALTESALANSNTSATPLTPEQQDLLFETFLINKGYCQSNTTYL